jgi:hypothetical protein
MYSVNSYSDSASEFADVIMSSVHAYSHEESCKSYEASVESEGGTFHRQDDREIWWRPVRVIL